MIYVNLFKVAPFKKHSNLLLILSSLSFLIFKCKALYNIEEMLIFQKVLRNTTNFFHNILLSYNLYKKAR